MLVLLAALPAVSPNVGLLIARLLPTSLCAYVPPLTVSVKLSDPASPLTAPPLATLAPAAAVVPSYSFVSTTGVAIVSAFFVMAPVAAVGSVYW